MTDFLIVIFFVFMSFAALSTVVAVFENIISFAMDLFGLSRKKAVVINSVLLTVYFTGDILPWVFKHHSRASNKFVRPQIFDSLGQASFLYLSQTFPPLVTKTKNFHSFQGQGHDSPNKINRRYWRKFVLWSWPE